MNKGNYQICYKTGGGYNTIILNNVEFEELNKSLVFTDIDTKEFVYAFYYENLIYMKPYVKSPQPAPVEPPPDAGNLQMRG